MNNTNRFSNAWRMLAHAVERRRHPQRFILVDQTPWQEIYRDGIMAVRHYTLPARDSIVVENQTISVENRRHATPVLLVPALGIQPWTFDLMPTRSMVRYLMARGFDVYLLDWGKPSQSDRELNLDTYVNHWLPAAVEAVREHAGVAEVSLVGYCMGGLLSLMYLGGHANAPVANLATIASPVNFHKSGFFGALSGLVSIPAMKIHEWFQVRLEPVDSQLFHVPGSLLSLGFKLTNPPGVVASYIDLVRNIADREYVTEYMTMGQWFNDMVDYPGATVREVIEKMLIANSLADGRIEIGDRIADFTHIQVPLLAIAGRDDRSVSIRAARDIMRLAGSTDKHFEVLPGGHAGVFAGGRAPEYGWRMIADWLRPLSRD